MTTRAFGGKGTSDKSHAWEIKQALGGRSRKPISRVFRSADSLFTLLHMGTFLRQLWGRRWSGDRSFQPVPPFGEQASSREKLSSAPGLRAPDRATRGGLRSSESARGDGAQTPSQSASRSAGILSLNSGDAGRHPSTHGRLSAGIHPRRDPVPAGHRSPRTAARASRSHQPNKGWRTKSLVPRLALRQVDY